MSEESGVPVRALLTYSPDDTGLPLTLLAGAHGLQRRITSPHVQKTGLALAGYDVYLRPGRVLVFGESEVRYLEHLSGPARSEALRLALQHDIPCILISAGFDAPDELRAEAERVGVPVLQTTVATPLAIGKLNDILDDALAERGVFHAVLVDVLGLGVLLMGESGIGKSECALDLVVRGHRLVADDAVEVKRRTETVLIGTCPELTRHHMEIRGLGIIDLQQLFGVSSTRLSKRIELVVRLERWDPLREYDRLGLETTSFEMLGVSLPLVTMPVAPGRNVGTLVEVAARNHLLKAGGHHPGLALAARLDAALLKAAGSVQNEGEEK